MADPITREQVERLRAAVRAYIDGGEPVSEHALCTAFDEAREPISGNEPDYVIDAWHESGFEPFHAALTRWRDSLPVGKVARWDTDLEAYALTPIHDDGALMTHAVEDAAKARAWGYTIEGGPEVAEDSPAPEVVDVSQPVVKRCGGVAASWHVGAPCVFIDAGAASLHAPISLLRAMLAAIDAQLPAPTQPVKRRVEGGGQRVLAASVALPVRARPAVPRPRHLGDLKHDRVPAHPVPHLVAWLGALETARRTVAWLRERRDEQDHGMRNLTGYQEWKGGVSGVEWAAQLERLLGDAP